MERVKNILRKWLHPPVMVLIFVPLLSFAVLISVFAAGKTKNTLAYVSYGMSAYSLVIWLVVLPGLTKRIRRSIMSSNIMKKAADSKTIRRYLKDLSFRGSVGIYQGIVVNLFYVVLRIIAGIRYASAWFVSMAVYYLVLGGLRLYLILCYRRRSPDVERSCYRKTAWMLFLLNIPMAV